MKKRIYIIVLMLCTVSLRAADSSLVALSKKVAPVTKQVSNFRESVENISLVVDALREKEYPVDVLMHLPVVEGQMPNVPNAVAVYAFIGKDDGKPTLAYSKSKSADYLAKEGFPLVGRSLGKRYIPLVDEINQDGLSKIEDYDQLCIEAQGYTIEKQLDERGHDLIKGGAGTHYYDLLRLCMDFNRVQECNEIVSNFPTNNLHSNTRLYDAFFAAQWRVMVSGSERKKEQIKQMEPMFIKKSAPMCTQVAQTALAIAGVTGFMVIACVGDDSEPELSGSLPLRLLYNQTMG